MRSSHHNVKSLDTTKSVTRPTLARTHSFPSRLLFTTEIVYHHHYPRYHLDTSRLTNQSYSSSNSIECQIINSDMDKTLSSGIGSSITYRKFPHTTTITPKFPSPRLTTQTFPFLPPPPLKLKHRRSSHKLCIRAGAYLTCRRMPLSARQRAS